MSTTSIYSSHRLQHYIITEEVKTGSQVCPHDPIHFWPFDQFSKIEREGKIQRTLNCKLYYITSTPNKGVQILTFTPTLIVEVLQLCISQVIHSKENKELSEINCTYVLK